jgi:hypothetical protein
MITRQKHSPHHIAFKNCPGILRKGEKRIAEDEEFVSNLEEA